MLSRKTVLYAVLLGVFILKRRWVMRLFRKMKYSEAEWETRVELAALYRLAQKMGLDEGIYNHITARVPGEEALLINAFGLRHDEITASNLLKIDMKGNILDGGSLSCSRVNSAGLVIHSAVHEARPDLHCVVHHHEKSCVALASSNGWMVTTQQAAIIDPYVSKKVHEYEGIAVCEEEKTTLVENLGTKRILMLKNHGALIGGATVAEAFELTRIFDMACTQLCHQLMTVGGVRSRLEVVTPEIIVQTERRLKEFQAGSAKIGNKVGALEFQAEIRKLKLNRHDRSFSS